MGRRGIFMIDASKARDINALGVYWKVFSGLLKRPAEFARRRRTNSGVLPGNAETLPKKKPRATRPSRVLLRVRSRTLVRLEYAPTPINRVCSMAINPDDLQRRLRDQLCASVRVEQLPDGKLMLQAEFEFPDGDRYPIRFWCSAIRPRSLEWTWPGYRMWEGTWSRRWRRRRISSGRWRGGLGRGDWPPTPSHPTIRARPRPTRTEQSSGRS